ncbi:metal-dependent transcriptional regulator [Fervidobacterium thailandense]|uniref:DNA-binding protein n=1 Tax=Fervidobacterium thailandense TaxID=1008305 RepID=A0A1E3G1V0_9BACT|nr:metal-dependent transcriptional regulator [Fervidobacterium thailandense]ODN30225.1 DNA-binding protein [Fervidobacterium thailandense]
MEHQIGSTERKYLLAVYLTLNQMGWTRLKKISEFLNVKMPSAKQFLERLSEQGLIYYEPRGSITLTAEGKKVAITENTKLNAVKMFFCEILGLDENEATQASWNVYFNLGDKIVERFIAFARFLVEGGSGEIVGKFREFLNQPRKRTTPCPIKSILDELEEKNSSKVEGSESEC